MEHITITAEEVKVGMALDFNLPGQFYAENYYIVTGVEFSQFGDSTLCVDLTFKDTNDGQPYSYEPGQALRLAPRFAHNAL